jgi:signal transduction histidine kinase
MPNSQRSPEPGVPAMPSPWFITRIMQPAPSADSSWSCARVADFFSRHNEVDILPVVDRQSVLGMVYRMDFFNKFFQKYGPEIFGNEPVARMMDAKPLIVAHDALINDVSLWISKNRPELFHRGFAVTKEQQYQGLVIGLALVQATSEQLGETVAELSLTQKSLIESEKMASLGNLVAGVAHELNTPIGNALLSASAFMGRINDIAGSAERGELVRSTFDNFILDSTQLADLIYRQCLRAGQLISSFKRVAIDQTSEQRRAFDLRDLIDDHIAALGPSLMQSCWRIEVDVPHGIGCDSYPGPLGQVIDNLIQNAAIHAFAGREAGVLQIHATIAATIAATTAATTAATSSDTMVELQFRDDGNGIKESDQKRIFDPFFTTRLGQGGSGLGLFISKNIITGLLGGSLMVRSEPGQGTCFLIRFPLLAPTPSAPTMAAVTSHAIAQPVD